MILDSSTVASSQRAASIVRTLQHVYEITEPAVRRAPLDELVLTILSQSTTDSNCERAFRRLRDRFDSWEAVRSATVDEVEDAIRVGGLATRKAPRIQQVVAQVLDSRLLESLDRLPLPEAKRQLMALPGVGPKTAACVLLFACGRPALPVDTHVHRVSLRLGLLPLGTSAAQAHKRLESIVAPEDVYAFHVGLIRHGRAVCHAGRPRCHACVLTPYCCYVGNQATQSQAGNSDADD